MNLDSRGLLVMGSGSRDVYRGRGVGENESDASVETPTYDTFSHVRTADRYVYILWKHCMLLSSYQKRRGRYVYARPPSLPEAILPPGACPVKASAISVAEAV
jgi:hypothetical protein